MDMLSDAQIARAGLVDWRKLGQGLHARFVVPDLATGARFATELAELGDGVGDHLRVTLGDSHVDLKLISADAVFRDAAGDEHVVEWVTQHDIDLAIRISAVANARALVSDPAGITTIELALDTARSAAVSPVWAALLTGSASARGHGSIGDDVRDATGRVPILWFQTTDDHDAPRQRFHIDVWVAPEAAAERIAAAVAAGGVVVDASQAPSWTVIADPDGNRGCVCTSLDPAAAPVPPAPAS